MMCGSSSRGGKVDRGVYRSGRGVVVMCGWGV